MPSPLHILPFSLHNPYTLSVDPDNSWRVLIRLLTTPNTPINEIDLSAFRSQRILITGATGGCGFECARAFARVGCHLILTARNKEKGDAAVKDIRAAGVHEGSRIDVLELDMGDWESVRGFGKRVRGFGDLHLAVLNAGVYTTGFGKCETGMEEVTQVNVLSTLAISLLTLPLLKASPTQSRLLLISSEAHGWSNPQQTTFTDLIAHLNNPDEYPSYMRYHISKLLICLWTQILSESTDSSKVLISSASPGFTRTGIFRGFNAHFLAGMIEGLVCRNVEQGAAQYLLAIKGMEDGEGGFWSDGGFRRPSTATMTNTAVKLKESMWAGLQEVLPGDLVDVGKKLFG